MTVGSLFSGIGGFDLGFERSGHRIAWQVEIDPHCRTLLATKFQNAIIHEDISHVGAGTLEPVDLICGGFPCQDLSVAGRRAGLAGERSGLWFQFHRILGELAPRWCVIENVPGLLSSNGGADFAVILRGLVELGYRVTWRVLDARHFGVAQRRRRVFIVGSLGDGSSAEVLFEPESVRRDSAKGRAAREGTAPTLAARTRGGGGLGTDSECDGGVIEAPFAIKGAAIGRKPENGPQYGEVLQDGSMYTLNATEQHAVVVPAISSKWAKGTGGPSGDECQNLVPTLNQRNRGATDFETNGGLVPTAFHLTQDPISGDVSPAMSGGNQQGCATIGAATAAGVRRLTPRECERLQGFPDDWTEGFSDSTRYKMLGNAVCVPVARWIGIRIT